MTDQNITALLTLWRATAALIRDEAPPNSDYERGQMSALRFCADELAAALLAGGQPQQLSKGVQALNNLAADASLRVKGWDSYGAEPLQDAAVAAARMSGGNAPRTMPI